MSDDRALSPLHPRGEQLLVDLGSPAGAQTLDTIGGPVKVEWDATSPLTPLASYVHQVGYLTFYAGAVLKAKGAGIGSRSGSVAKRILAEHEVALLLRATRTSCDRLLLTVAYAGGLRVSDLVRLTWGDVITRSDGRAQLSTCWPAQWRRPSPVGAREAWQAMAGAGCRGSWRIGSPTARLL
jgi:hypothetical protein